MPNTAGKSLVLIQCNASLEVLHAHLLRAAHPDDDQEWILAYPEWVSALVVLRQRWTKVIAGRDTRPEYGNIAQRLHLHFETLKADIAFESYDRIELVISDLSWLMNNVLLAWLYSFCREKGIDFELSFMDEGAVLYTGTRLGIIRTLRSMAKYIFLKSHGLPSVFVHPWNADYLHSLCRQIYCLHPQLLNPPPSVKLERIKSESLTEIYGDRIPDLNLPPCSGLYLSQPLYKRVGIDRQLQVVRSMRDRLFDLGISRLYYKAHHADAKPWCDLLESECGLHPLPLREVLPVEMVAATSKAEVIVSHLCSALLNLKSYGYSGRVIAYGLEQLSAAFPERSQLEDYCRALRRIGNVEMLAAPLFCRGGENEMTSVVES